MRRFLPLLTLAVAAVAAATLLASRAAPDPAPQPEPNDAPPRALGRVRTTTQQAHLYYAPFSVN